MAVNVKEESQVDQQDEQQEVNDKFKALANDLVPPLDEPEEEKKPKKKEVDDLEGGKVDLKKLPEDDADEAEEEEEIDEDEEVLPKSKFEKRIRSEIEKRRVLEAEVKALKEKAEASSDPRRSKLEAMSKTELKTLKHDALLRFKSEEDPTVAQQVLELVDEIEEVIQTAPQKFEQSQAKAVNEATQRILADNDDIDFEDTKVVEHIKGIASDIYSRYPNLHKLVDGQATALELAVDHYKAVGKVDKVKSKEGELKRKVNKLKRKTSLGSGTASGKAPKANLKALREKAKSSQSVYDKEAYLANLIDVDSYLPAEHKRS